MKSVLPLSKPSGWLLISIVCAASMAWYITVIWSFHQPSQFSDLYAPWWGAHELLLHGRNPYSPTVAHEIQTVIYDAPVTPSADDPSGIGGGFAYPLYTAFLLWPTLYLSFSAAKLIVVWLSLLLTLLSVECWLQSLHWRPAFGLRLTLAFFVLASFPCLEALKLQNLSLFAAALISLGLFLLSTGRLTLAGVVLAFATFKPQFTITLIPWLMLWTAADWRRRRSLAWSFLAGMLVLLSASEALLPGWLHDFVSVIRAYRHYTYGHSILDVWFTPLWGSAAAFVVLAISAALCWPSRSQPASSNRFWLATSLLLAANVVVIPTLAPHAQLLLVPGFFCLLRDWPSPFATKLPIQTFYYAATVWILLAWSWIAALGLMLAGVHYPTAVLHRFWQVPLYTSPLLPVALFLFLSRLLFSSGNMQQSNLK
jgi:hypothetical protein